MTTAPGEPAVQPDDPNGPAEPGVTPDGEPETGAPDQDPGSHEA